MTLRVAILGSTGSIGRSTLRVIDRHPERFEVVALAANRRVDALADQVARYRPETAVVADVEVACPDGVGSTTWRSGAEALCEVAGDPTVDVVVNALVGAAGLPPTLAALEAGHRLALANKESLVAGGAIVLAAAHAGGAEIVPIDSEHSAILQCLEGSDEKAVQRIVLTASGGPFRGRSADEVRRVRPEDALQHPTWDMGAKITIDSATLANKALEVIEAHWLYGIGYERIDAVVHPQSVVHSFVEFVDGSVLAQLGFPTMELPILYSLTYPERIDDRELRTFDPVQAANLTFESIDHEAFPMFGLGVEAGRRSGCAPAVYNAANEVAVAAFLEGRVRFPEIADVVGNALDRIGASTVRDLDDIIAADRAARTAATEASKRLGNARMGTT